jgi:hypothetical protein
MIIYNNEKKLLLDDTELEYNIFQSSTKESLNCINSTNEKIISYSWENYGRCKYFDSNFF